MAFRVGQKCVCINANRAANPWHRANPLVKGHIYVVRELLGIGCMDIDGSGRAWECERFRPLVSTTTGMAILEQIRRDVTNKELRPICIDEQA